MSYTLIQYYLCIS